MVVKTVTYTDFDGNERTEDFHFNYTQAEMAQMEMSLNGGLSTLLTKMAKEQDNKELVKLWKNFIVGAYGIKSLDGKRFVKNDEIREDFESSAAFSEIFMELSTSTEAMTDFINTVIPKDIKDNTKKPVIAEKVSPEVVKPHA